MTKRFIKELVGYSMTEKGLDETRIDAIASRLTRRELKAYFRGIKNEVAKNTVTITTSKKVGSSLQKEMDQRFSNKHLNFQVDPEILFGIMVKDGDMVYDNTLRSSFREIVDYIKE